VLVPEMVAVEMGLRFTLPLTTFFGREAVMTSGNVMRLVRDRRGRRERLDRIGYS